METCLASSPNLLTMGENLPLTDMTKSLLILLTGAAIPNSESIITNLSFEPTWNWYYKLTPFEAIFLGLLIAQFAVLNLVGIMPVNVNKWMNGDIPGRSLRKKRKVDREVLERHENLAQTMLQVLKRMDRDECFLRALCEIQSGFSHDAFSLPRETKLTLDALRRSSVRRKNKKNVKVSTRVKRHIEDGIEDDDEDDAGDSEMEIKLEPFLLLEEAVEHGMKSKVFESPDNNYSNNSVCLERYSSCPASTQDIFSYFETIKEHYFN